MITGTRVVLKHTDKGIPAGSRGMVVYDRKDGIIDVLWDTGQFMSHSKDKIFK